MMAVHTILTTINVYWAQIHNNRYQSLKQVQRNYRPLAMVPTHAMKTRRRLSRPLVKRTVSTRHHPICHQTARSAMDLSSIYLYVLIYWHALFLKWSDTRLMVLAVWSTYLDSWGKLRQQRFSTQQHEANSQARAVNVGCMTGSHVGCATTATHGLPPEFRKVSCLCW